MGLSSEQKQIIENNIARLDYLKGTGVLSNGYKNLANEMFVFIGAGGVGGKALRQVKETLEREVDAQDVRKRTMFLWVDSDHTDIDDAVSRGYFVNDEVLKIPFNGAHDSIDPARILPQREKWVHPELWQLTGGAAINSPEFSGVGAGAIRQCGRVLFSQSNTQTELQNKLSMLQVKLAGMGGAGIKVFFFAGLAGGTGSGTILDLTYLTRYFLKTLLGVAYERTQFSAYLFLPKACSDPTRPITPMDAINGNKNAYAALKEIDYFMTMSDRDEHFQMDYGTPVARNVDLTDNVFDFCTLVDGAGAQGVFLQDPAQSARQIAADSIMNIICSQNAQVINGQNLFLVDSFLSNKGAQARTRIEANSDAEWPRDVNYIYSVIGYSSCVVPVDLLTVYVANKIFNAVWKKWERIRDVNEDSVRSFIDACGLSLRTLERTWQTLTPQQMRESIQAQADTDFQAYGPYYMTNLTLEASQLIRTDPADYYTKASVKSGEFMANKQKWNRIMEIYQAAAKYLSKINNELYAVYTYAVKVLKDLLEHNGKIMTDAQEYKSVFGRTFCWSPIDLTKGEQATEAVTEYLDDILGKDGQTVQKLANQFVKDLCNKKDEWTQVEAPEGKGIAGFNVANEIRNFIATHLQACVNTTVEQFVVKAYSGRKDAPVSVLDPKTGQQICSEETRQAAQAIYDRLSNQATPLAATRTGYALGSCYANLYLTVPENCKWLYEAMKDVANAHAGEIGTVFVFKSTAKDSIVLSRLYAGVPAWGFHWTAGAEADYEHGDGPRKIGLHMDQGKDGRDWSYFPNLYPEKLWTQSERTERKREADISAGVRQDMEDARTLDLLEKDHENYDVYLLTDKGEKAGAENVWLELSKELENRRYSSREIYELLEKKGVLERFTIGRPTQIMTTPDTRDWSEQETEDWSFGLAGRTIRREVRRYQALARTIPFIKAIDSRNADRVITDMSMIADFLETLKWETVFYDYRQAKWKYRITDEAPLGDRLATKIQKICAHYYGFQAYSQLTDKLRGQINAAAMKKSENAKDEEYDTAATRMDALREGLTALRHAEDTSEKPWPADSPFKDANGSAWPMSTDLFVEAIGDEAKAKEIRDFYTELINNL